MTKKHDNFFRTVFSNPKRAAKLLELASKRNERLQKFISLVNLQTLQEISEEAPREGLNGSADVAFTVKLANSNQEAKLLIGLLMEHKSFKPPKARVATETPAAPQSDNLTLREQLLKYYYEVMYQKVGNVPVVAIVVYSGAEIWKELDEKPYPDAYPDYFQDVGLPFKVEFINVGDEISAKDFANLDPLMKLVLIAMRYAFDTLGMSSLFGAAVQEYAKMNPKDGRSVIEEIIVYLRTSLPPEQKETLMDTLYEYQNKGFKSIRDVDIEIGERQGEERLANALKELGVSANLIERARAKINSK